MSGVSISVTVVDQQVRRAFDQLAVHMGNTAPVMSAIGTALVASTHMRFVSQTDPDGAAWRALNTEYAKGKRNTRILTESGRLRDSIYAKGKRNTRILTESGRLRDSINDHASRDEVSVGTNVIYAAIHQFGGTIVPVKATHLWFRIDGGLVRADSVTLPARPFLGISTEDEAEIAEIVFAFVDRYIPR